MAKDRDLLDAIGILGTVLGFLNYGENLTQSKFQDEMEVKTADLHKHLLEQDEKIDKILEALNDSRRDLQKDSEPSNTGYDDT